MKFNKWTMGLAAVGAVSLVSVAQAEEKMNAVQTALSSTTLSGYVSASAEWNIGKGNGQPIYSFNTGKADGFNLDVVKLSLSKPLDASEEWAAGYTVDLLFGPDAVGYNPSVIGSSGQDVGIKQAYVNLRTPVGNGIEWKIGVFDTIVGYESFDAGNNPNYTRSYGYSLEPTEHTGILGTYRVSDLVSVSAGIADTVDAGINNRSTFSPGRNPSYETYKTYMASVSLTAPKDMGFLEGSTLYAGVVNGFNTTGGFTQSSYYLGGTLATPVAGLKLGAAFDYLDGDPVNGGDAWVFGLYASYQATEKLSVHGRGEFLRDQGGYAYGSNSDVWEGTATIQYDLWKNVVSRAEFRWDNKNNGGFSGPSSSNQNAYLLAANLIYKF